VGADQRPAFGNHSGKNNDVDKADASKHNPSRLQIGLVASNRGEIANIPPNAP
jgi:hypothetical protein